jgi:hypothetical protein
MAMLMGNGNANGWAMAMLMKDLYKIDNVPAVNLL